MKKVMTKKTTIHLRQKLLSDIEKMKKVAIKEGYLLTIEDVFAIGYMCGKYNVKKLLNNQDEVIQACNKYDEYDDLAILDTIAETLIDLGVIDFDKYHNI